eukprot:8913443-Ditylum_brightwellii.AAC.1
MGKKYFDTKAAMAVNGCEMKKPLEDDPVIKLFEYRNVDGKEGYWSYDHMVLQSENIIDVIYVVFADSHDVLMPVDHSNGHDWMRPDALNVNCRNVGFGGNLPQRCTVLK